MVSQNAAKPHPQISKPMRRDLPPPLPPPPPPPPQNPNPSVPFPSPAAPPAEATASDSTTSSSSLCVAANDDPALAATVLLSREEVLRRRSRRLKCLERLYRDQYWALAEEARRKHREYYWNYGLSPAAEERGLAAGEEGNNGDNAAVGEEEEVGGKNRVARQRSRCVFAGCKSMAMPLTRFCHQHILSDRNQTLYKACSYAVKSGQSGPITCGKPVLRAAIPSLCSLHLQKAQKHVSHALKKAGFNPSSSSRVAPKFHVIITEYVQQIQSKRREAPNAHTESNAELDGNVG